jgi:hypothetical protein
MRELGSNGTTVVFVSHELAAVESLCQEAVWLERGRLVDQGPIGDILRAYSRSLSEGQADFGDEDGDRLRCVRVVTSDERGRQTATFHPGDPVDIDLSFSGPGPLHQPRVHVRITDGSGEDLIECVSPPLAGCPLGPAWTARCRIDAVPLNPRLYQVWCRVTDPSDADAGMAWREVGAFRIEDRHLSPGGTPTSVGVPPVAVRSRWSIER